MPVQRRQAVQSAGVVLLLVLVVAVLAWIGGDPVPAPRIGQAAASSGELSTSSTLTLGLVPERDIFDQRHRYRQLADHLAQELHRPVRLVTLNTYEAVLLDLAEGEIDGAFLGSMVAVLAHDRLGVRLVAKPVYENDVSTYRGVLFVPGSSPLTTIQDLRGRSLAMVRTTTAGHLFPL